MANVSGKTKGKTANPNKNMMSCQRCGGRMIFEKFYDVNNIFFGWHCVICGEILDPVILLHRLSQNADIKIPDGEENIMNLLMEYMHGKPKKGPADKGSRA